MVVRVRSKPLGKLFLGVTADLLCWASPEYWYGSGVSQTELYISTRKARSSAGTPWAATPESPGVLQ